METNSATSVATNNVDGDGGRLGYAAILQERFDALSDDERAIIECHKLADSPLTLDELGKLRGVTRERIRQIEDRALERVLCPGPKSRPGRPRKSESDPACLAAREEAAHKAELVDAAVEELQALPLPVTESALIDSGLGPVDAVPTRLLILAASRRSTWRGKVVEYEGRRWLTGEVTPARFVAQITEDARELGVVEDLVELWEGIEERLRRHVGSSAEAEDVAAQVVEDLAVAEVGDRYAILGGRISVPERLVRILRANGAPMSGEALIAAVADRASRFVRNNLFEDDRIVQVGADEFSLAEWGAKPRPALLELVYGAIDEHGNVAVDYLERLAEEHHYSAASIAFYRALPDLIEEAGVLRRRTAEDRSGIPEPGLDDTCVRVISGPHRGCWSTIVTINHRRLYTGPQKLPGPLANFLGVKPGVRRMPLTIDDTFTVRSTWGSYPYLFGGELRPVLDQLGFADGDLVRFIVRDPGNIIIESVPATPEDPRPLDVLAAAGGLYDDEGQPVSRADLAGELAYALGLEPTTPVFMVGRRLSARRDMAVLSAFEIVFADELGA
jgi:hypothetical protein